MSAADIPSFIGPVQHSEREFFYSSFLERYCRRCSYLFSFFDEKTLTLADKVFICDIHGRHFLFSYNLFLPAHDVALMPLLYVDHSAAKAKRQPKLFAHTSCMFMQFSIAKVVPSATTPRFFRSHDNHCFKERQPCLKQLF